MNQINLNGTWKLYFDSPTSAEPVEVEVPGAVEKYLEDRTFSGPFIYEKKFGMKINSNMKYILSFKGVSYYCEVRVNGKFAGRHEGVWDAFSFDITENLKDGENTITVKIIKPDYDSKSKYFYRSVLFGFIPDILMPFGGIWKDVAIFEKSPIYFEEVYPQFNMEDESLEVEYRIGGDLKGIFQIQVEVTDPEGRLRSFISNVEIEGILRIKPADLILWSPEEPKLYKIEVKLVSKGIVMDSYTKRLGARRIEKKDGKIFVNEKLIYLRGILHWGYYPELFTPNPSYETVKEELKRIKAMGFNGVKHCLYFPPEYYYELCDEMGMLLWQELPLWLPYANDYLMGRVYEQYPKMVKLFINHASVILLSIGCELDATISGTVLNDLYEMINSRNSQAIICDNSGSGECYDGVSDSKSDIYDYHFYAEIHNLETLINEFTQSYRERKPWLFGEYNDIDTWRDMDKVRKAFDYELYWCDKDEKKNLLRLTHKGFGSDQPVYMQEEILNQYGVMGKLDGLKEISYAQAYEARKYILELTRRYSAISGYNITKLRDVASTTAGIFDDFDRPKWEPEEFNKINGDIVLIYSKDLGRIWFRGADRFQSRDLYNHFSGENLKGKIILSNTTGVYGEGKLEIKIIEGEREVYKQRTAIKITAYDSLNISDLNLPLPKVYETTQYKLTATLVKGGRTLAENDWNIWVHPSVSSESKIYLLDSGSYFSGVEKYFNIVRINSLRDLKKDRGILVTSYYDKEAEALMAKGWMVLYIQQGHGFFPHRELPFWREGIRRIESHRVTDSLKHNGYAGLQFFSLGTDVAFDRLEILGIIGDYTPIITRHDGRKFDVCEYMFEYSRGNGKTIVTSLRLQGGQGSQARSFEENTLAIQLLDNVIKYFSEKRGD